LVNQFPFEATLTVKDLVASAIQAAYSYEDGNEEPAWFKPAYNLDLDLPAFVAEFHRRRRPPATGGDGEGVNEGEGEDNTWIIKPWFYFRQIFFLSPPPTSYRDTSSFINQNKGHLTLMIKYHLLKKKDIKL
jgi:hypothetical protein